MKLVIKVGTQAMVTDRGHINTQLLGYLAYWMADMMNQGHQVILVTSGAVGLGKQMLSEANTAKSGHSGLTTKQAAAAMGQPKLMSMYQQLMSVYQQNVAQILVSGSDFSQRERYLNLQNTLTFLLNNKVLPIINENDVLSDAALAEDVQTSAFSDNDHLSAIIAAKLNADVLIILTNVNGVYTANPVDNPTAERISRITDLNQINQLNISGQSSMGRGGMRAKLQAAKLAAMCGVNTWIAPFNADLNQVLQSQNMTTGTWITALPEQLAAKQQWIAYGSGCNGVLTINNGAKAALIEQNASLLAVGVTGATGLFVPNQVVGIQDEQGNELGRGITLVSQETMTLWLKNDNIPRNQEVVHRNNLVIYSRYCS